MSAVPNSMRQGSAALGANRMQTSMRVVFPAALSGIVAAVVLGVSRAVGETMIVAIAAGGQARIVAGPLEQGQTMTGFIANAGAGRLASWLNRVRHAVRGRAAALRDHVADQLHQPSGSCDGSGGLLMSIATDLPRRSVPAGHGQERRT